MFFSEEQKGGQFSLYPSQPKEVFQTQDILCAWAQGERTTQTSSIQDALQGYAQGSPGEADLTMCTPGTAFQGDTKMIKENLFPLHVGADEACVERENVFCDCGRLSKSFLRDLYLPLCRELLGINSFIVNLPCLLLQ